MGQSTVEPLTRRYFMSKHAGLKIHEADSYLMYTEYFLKISHARSTLQRIDRS